MSEYLKDNETITWQLMNTGNLSFRTTQNIRQCLTTKRRRNK